MSLDAWKRIVPNPCNHTVQRRNEAATRDALQEIADYLNNLNITGGDGDAIVFFEVQDTAVGAPSVSVQALDLADNFSVTGPVYTAYDYTPIMRFSRNFREGAYGVGRLAPEIATDALVVIELSGPARFVHATLTADMDAGEATADVDQYYGAFPNAQDPGSTVTLHDRLNLAPHAKTGDLAIGVWDDDASEYVLMNLNDEEVLYFKFSESQIGQKSCLADELVFRETVLGNGDWTLQTTGRTLRVWDLTPNRRFAKNFVQDFYGIGRQALEIGNDHVVAMEVEGRARFIDGSAQEPIPRGGSGEMTILNHWGGYSNLFKYGSNEIEVFDRDRFGPIDVGDSLVAVWDEQAQKYIILFSNHVPENPAVIAVGEICNGETNGCCVWDGLVHQNNGPGVDGCTMDRCFQKVWIGCENRDLEPDTDYCDVFFACSSGQPILCAWVRDTGTTLSCGGDERPLWVAACPCSPCACPDECDTVTGRWSLGGAACTFPDVEMNCVTKNPITEATPDVGQNFFWGEFQVDGKYPLMGQDFDLDPASHPSGLDYTPPGGTAPDDTFNVSSVFIVFEPDDSKSACDASQLKLYVEGNDGLHYPLAWTGIYLDPAGGLGPLKQLLLTDDNCATFVNRSFFYGILASCGAAPSYTVQGILMYHLPGGHSSMYALRNTTTDECSECGAVSVPGAGSPYYEDDVGIEPDTTISLCCGVSNAFVLDSTNWGYIDTSIRNALSSCTAGSVDKGFVAPDGNSVVLEIDTMAMHVLGGCIDYYEKFRGTANPAENPGGYGKVKTCGGNPNVPAPRLFFLWDGRSQECE